MKKVNIILLLATTLLLSGCGNDEKNVDLLELGISEEEIISTDKPIDETNYILDTTYDGADVAPELYEVAFEQSDMYVKNKELMTYMEEKKLDANDYLVTAEDYFNTMVGNNYITIQNEQEAFLDKVESFNPDGAVLYIDDEPYEVSEYADNIMQMFVDNEVDASVDFKSDDSLLYSDCYYFLRGELDITLHGGNAEAFKTMYGITVAEDVSVPVMVELCFLPNDAEHVIGFSVLGYIEDAQK